MVDFYRALDRMEHERKARLIADRPENLHDYNGCEKDPKHLRERIASLEAALEKHRELAACAYQMAGVHGAPERFLGALSAAAGGKEFDTESLLPVNAPEDEPRTDHDHATCQCMPCRMERAEAALREKEQERFAPLGDNHHNAAKCPYCNPQLAAMHSELAQARADYEELRLGRKLDTENVSAALERAEKAEQEFAQARAENERLKAPLPKNPLCHGDGNCPGVCGGCLELTTNKEYRLAIALRDAGSERDSLRSQLEAMRTVLDDLRNFYCNRECETMPDHDALCKKTSAFLAARAKQEAKV